MKCLTFVILCAAVLHGASAYYITIDASEEQCYFERVIAGTGLTIMFEVAEGGFRDVDFKITRPDGSVVYSDERQSSGKFTFTADTDGAYTYCFGNKMSSMTPKEVLFTVDIKPSPSAPTTPAVPMTMGPENNPRQEYIVENHRGHPDMRESLHRVHVLAETEKLEEMIAKLNSALLVVKREQEYMETRDRAHRSINDNTNNRVFWWAIFEAVVLMGMTVSQVYYLRRYFEVRTLV